LAVNAPPLLVSFSSLDAYLKALPEDVRDSHQAEIERLVHAGLPPVVSFRALATLFGFSTKFIGALYRNPERYYRTFSIRSGKKVRIIQSPRVGIKVIQKWFGYHLAQAIELSDAVVGFVPGRSAVHGASQHCGADWAYSTDIRDFFTTTPIGMVLDALARLGYSKDAAALLARLFTYQGTLPQGSPASPVLSNLVFQDVDSFFEKTASEMNARYTRYADDVVFSGKGVFPEDLKQIVTDAITSKGWAISPHKESLAVRPSRLKVYGLIVEGDEPRLTKGYRNRIRAFKHLKKNGQIREDDLDRINGHLSYADWVDRFASKLKN